MGMVSKAIVIAHINPGEKIGAQPGSVTVRGRQGSLEGRRSWVSPSTPRILEKQTLAWLRRTGLERKIDFDPSSLNRRRPPDRTQTNTGEHVDIDEGLEGTSLKELCKLTSYVRKKMDFFRKVEVAQNRRGRLFNKNTSLREVEETKYAS